MSSFMVIALHPLLRAVLLAEDRTGHRFVQLVRTTRRIVGRFTRSGWQFPAPGNSWPSRPAGPNRTNRT